MSDLIQAGRLRVACDISVTTNRGYHCCYFERARNKPQTGLFVDRLIEQAGITPAISGLDPPSQAQQTAGLHFSPGFGVNKLT